MDLKLAVNGRTKVKKNGMEGPTTSCSQNDIQRGRFE